MPVSTLFKMLSDSLLSIFKSNAFQFIVVFFAPFIFAQADFCLDKLKTIRASGTTLSEFFRQENTLLQNVRQQGPQPNFLDFAIDCPDQFLDMARGESIASAGLEYIEKKAAPALLEHIEKNSNWIHLMANMQAAKKIQLVLTQRGSQSAKKLATLVSISNQRDLYARKQKTCSDVKIDETHMGPVRNQQDINLCYAFTAADLLSFHVKERVSAPDMAVLYNNFSPAAAIEKMQHYEKLRELRLSEFRHPQEMQFLSSVADQAALSAKEIKRSKELVLEVADGVMEGGYSNQALEAVKKYGACREAEFTVAPHTHFSLKQRMAAASYFKEFGFDSENECVNRPGRALSLFPKAQLEPLLDIVQGANTISPLWDLRQKLCTTKIQFPLDKKITTAKGRSDSMMLLNQAFDRGEPAIVDVWSRMINSNLTGVHSVVAVERKWNSSTGECQYKIRNSWGADRAPQIKDQVQHEEGYFWISDDQLFGSTIRAHALSPK